MFLNRVHTFLLSFIYLFCRRYFFTPCVWFLSFRVSHSVFPSIALVTNYALIITIYFFASFSVARVSHDEAKLGRERASDQLRVASKGIGRGGGSGRRENAAD